MYSNEALVTQDVLTHCDTSKLRCHFSTATISLLVVSCAWAGLGLLDIARRQQINAPSREAMQ
eukprot:scaffold74603_cov63-Cyclotella_meneghiniana.AAC.3